VDVVGCGRVVVVVGDTAGVGAGAAEVVVRGSGAAVVGVAGVPTAANARVVVVDAAADVDGESSACIGPDEARGATVVIAARRAGKDEGAVVPLAHPAIATKAAITATPGPR
jgi:hypothetical protein